MKVLHISCDGLGNGGVQNVIMNICRNMSDISFDIVLFTNEKRYYDNEFISLGGRIFRIPKYEGNNIYWKRVDYYIRFFRIFFGICEIIRKNGPYDAIHCHNNFESGICCMAAFFTGVKIRITHAHTAEVKYRISRIIGLLYRMILRIIMNLFSNVKIGCSEIAFIRLFGEKYLTRKRTYIIPNPIDTKKFLNIENNRNPYEKCIVHIGRFCDNKNQIFLLEIMPYIIQNIPNAKLKLVGFNEEYKNLLLEKVNQLSLGSKVLFFPSETDIRKVLSDASLFIFPSKEEGFGIVLLEAQSMGVQCLVSDTVPKDTDCGLCRYLSLSEGAEAWAKEAVKLLNTEYNTKLDQKKLSKFDIGNYVEKIECIYKGISYEGWDTYTS